MDSESTPRSISPWWWLLVLPIAGGIGWYVGQAPSAAPRPTAVAAAATPAPAAEVAAPTPAPLAGSSAPPPPPLAAPADGEVSRWMSITGAIRESQRTGKPIMIDFNADWCGPCQLLKREVFDNPTHGRAVQLAVIPVSIVDRVKEDGRNSPEIEALQQKFEVEGFPTLIVYSPGTGRVLKNAGFGGADYTVNWITEAAASVR